MKASVEDRTAQQRPENLRQKQVWNRPKLIATRRVAGNIYTQTAQLLNQSPHLGASGGNFLRNLGPADDHSGVFHQQPHNAAQTIIGWMLVP